MLPFRAHFHPGPEWRCRLLDVDHKLNVKELNLTPKNHSDFAFCRFGSWVISESTGIVYNDEMDDFTQPSSGGLVSSPSNYIRPAKSPMSSMTPMILLDENNDVSLVAGAAGKLCNVVLLFTLYVTIVHHLQVGFSL